jgi:hypothetical protein
MKRKDCWQDAGKKLTGYKINSNRTRIVLKELEMFCPVPE